jgi:hypothetical protein
VRGVSTGPGFLNRHGKLAFSTEWRTPGERERESERAREGGRRERKRGLTRITLKKRDRSEDLNTVVVLVGWTCNTQDEDTVAIPGRTWATRQMDMLLIQVVASNQWLQSVNQFSAVDGGGHSGVQSVDGGDGRSLRHDSTRQSRESCSVWFIVIG